MINNFYYFVLKSRQVTGKLNLCPYRNVSHIAWSCIRITSFLACTSFINLDTIPDEVVLRPKRSRKEEFDSASPSMYLIQACR